MKNLLQILILICGLVSFSALSDAISERIGWIKKEYADTRENLDTYQKIEYGFFGESAEGAGGYGYIAGNGGIRLIEVTYYGESGRVSYEFYFLGDSPYFILEQYYKYNMPIFVTEELAREWRGEDGVEMEVYDPEKTKLEEWRFYFDGETPVRILNPQNVEVEDSDRGKAVYGDALENLRRVKEELDKKATNPDQSNQSSALSRLLG